MNIVQALQDRKLLGQFLQDPGTWRAWFAFLRAFFGLAPADGDLELFRLCTGRELWPTAPASEAWVICGRRGGKSFVVSLLAAYLAAFMDHKGLVAGETGYVIIVAPTRAQAGIIKRYLGGFFQENELLRPLLVRETREEIELVNRVTISVLSSDFRSLRGFTAIAAVVDELAFMLDEGSRPDSEIIRALRPALATTGGPLICISSPYARRGALYDAWKAHHGKENDPVIVWQAPSLLMNPTLSVEAVERAKAEDPEGARAEWDAQFRADIESFVSRDALAACVVPGRHELPRVEGVTYCAFTDPSGGSSDSFTLGIAHEEGGRRVLDLVRERRPPFSPEDVVKEFCETLKAYGITTVTGDRYAGEWPRERFREHGIGYEPSTRSKSEIYGALLPVINSGQCELLDNERLVAQLAGLERRTARGGKDSIDHPPRGHDDLANAAAGALGLAEQPRSLGGICFIDAHGDDEVYESPADRFERGG